MEPWRAAGAETEPACGELPYTNDCATRNIAGIAEDMYTNLRTGQRCATGFRLSGVLCASDQIPESRCALPFEPRKHVVYPERRSSAVVYRGRSAQREDDRVVYPGPSRSDALCTRNVRPAALCTEVRVRNAVVRSSSGEQGVRKCGLTSNQCTQVVRQCAVTAISCQTCTQALRSSWADLARRDPTHLDAKDIRRLVPARRTSRGRASVTTGRAPPPHMLANARSQPTSAFVK